jgi:putative membrane protein
MLFIKIGYAAAIVGAILLTVLLAMVRFVEIPWYYSLPVALGLLLIPAYYHLKRNMVRYTLTDSKIEIDYGLIARTTRNIPLAKIQDVTVSASILQRLLGFGSVVVDNASEVGGTTILHNINNPRQYSDLILREMRDRH